MVAPLLLCATISQLPLVLLGYGIGYGIQGDFGLGVTPIALADAYQLFWIIIARIANNPEAIKAAWATVTQSYFHIIFTWGFGTIFVAVFSIARYSNKLRLNDDDQVESIFARIKNYLKADWKRDHGEKWYTQIARAIARTATLLLSSFLLITSVISLFVVALLTLTFFSVMGVMVGSEYVSQIRMLPTCETQKHKITLPLDQDLNARCEKIWVDNKLVAAGRHVLTLGNAEFIFDAKDNSAKKFIFKNTDYIITPY